MMLRAMISCEGRQFTFLSFLHILNYKCIFFSCSHWIITSVWNNRYHCPTCVWQISKNNATSRWDNVVLWPTGGLWLCKGLKKKNSTKMNFTSIFITIWCYWLWAIKKRIVGLYKSDRQPVTVCHIR